MAEVYEPSGVRFFDVASNREMLLVGPDQPFAGWLCFRGSDNQWVTQREATGDDIDRIADAPYFASYPNVL